MPFRRTLLERLESPPAPQVRSLPGSLEEAVNSIRQHLQVMLNTRHGGSQTVPDYGTSDLSDFYTGYESIDTLRREIQRSIERYEPRLADVQVSFAPREDDPHRIYFEIVASVVSEDDEAPAVFRTVLEGSGQVKVSRTG
jgi:type VI secretion system protein